MDIPKMAVEMLAEPTEIVISVNNTLKIEMVSLFLGCSATHFVYVSLHTLHSAVAFHQIIIAGSSRYCNICSNAHHGCMKILVARPRYTAVGCESPRGIDFLTFTPRHMPLGSPHLMLCLLLQYANHFYNPLSYWCLVGNGGIISRNS